MVLNSATFPRESEMFQQGPALAEKLLRPKLFHLYGLSTPLTLRTLWTFRLSDFTDFTDFMDFMDFTDFRLL